MANDTFDVRDSRQVASALDVIFSGTLLPSELGLSGDYVRRHDDTNGRIGPEQELCVSIGADGVIVVRLPDVGPLYFRPKNHGGRSPRTYVALLVLAEAIRRDNADSSQKGLSTSRDAASGGQIQLSPVKKEVVDAINILVDGSFWIPELNLQEVYIRKHDNAPAEYAPEHEIQGTFGPDGDAWLMLPGFESLRFRQYSGGGMSMRTLSGLLVLFEAIRQDNMYWPQ